MSWFLLIFSFGILILIFRVWGIPMRLNDPGFKYVSVEPDGSVRELDRKEQDYLLQEFHPADGNRPYIKPHYWHCTPDRRPEGYMLRSRVPWWIKIKPLSN